MNKFLNKANKVLKKVLNKLWQKFEHDPKTTVIGLLTFLSYLFAKYGLKFDPNDQMWIGMIGVFLVGVVAKDTKDIPPTGT